ncbi:response regulator [Haematobacter genomosp. 1]|uniref:DNA-binding response regulator n=1 Tax=Haematobacter genomosp. 1 TaxID=366618 RepID=A0A212ADX9_9RHOB|nr:response regulator transcription factor [Haematobacter genomosp. 1]OWJ79441.1 DNA-binding response regulator [Haematobacter genomosp. 1]
MTRILIVDDHPIFRRGLALSLAEAGDLVVCGEGATAEEAVSLARSLRPDVVLLDLSLPGGGLSALPALRLLTGVAVAVLTASEDSDDLTNALSAGAAGYIVKGVGGRTLIDAVRTIARGEGYVTPTVAARVISEMGRDARMSLPACNDQQAGLRARLLDQLTPRESAVLRLVAEGRSNKEIARLTEVHEKTVKNHMTRILYKLNARNRTEAAMLLRGERGGVGTPD